MYQKHLLDALPFCDDMDSLLINVSGHLLLLCPMLPQTNGQKKGSSQDESTEFQVNFEFKFYLFIFSYIHPLWLPLM